MAKDWSFEEVDVSYNSYRFADDDAIRVVRKGISVSPITWARMGYPETLRIQVSTDDEAMRLEVPGPFRVRVTTPERKNAQSISVTSAALARRLHPKLGSIYKHGKDNVFVRDATNGTLKP